MKTFNSFGALANQLRKNSIEVRIGMVTAMEISAIAVVGSAKAMLGTYQLEEMGPAKPWEELKDATKKGRLRQGYSENDPLLRSGELWASIDFKAEGNQFIVGSANQLAEYHEFGTDKIPPRAFLTPALYRNVPFMLKTIGQAVESALGGVN